MAEAMAQVVVGHKVIDKVIEDPVPQGHKGPDRDDLADLVSAEDGPVETGDEVADQLGRGEEGAEGEEEIGQQVVVEEVGRGDLRDQTRHGGGGDASTAGMIAHDGGVVGVGREGQAIEDGGGDGGRRGPGSPPGRHGEGRWWSLSTDEGGLTGDLGRRYGETGRGGEGLVESGLGPGGGRVKVVGDGGLGVDGAMQERGSMRAEPWRAQTIMRDVHLQDGKPGRIGRPRPRSTVPVEAGDGTQAERGRLASHHHLVCGGEGLGPVRVKGRQRYGW